MNTTSEFQPLFPDASAVAPLLQQAAALIAEGHRLESAAGALAPALKPLLRSMNSYYTNKIEGQHTRPTDIERALARQFDADQVQARKQRLAVAHIDTETELEAALPPRAADLYDQHSFSEFTAGSTTSSRRKIASPAKERLSYQAAGAGRESRPAATLRRTPQASPAFLPLGGNPMRSSPALNTRSWALPARIIACSGCIPSRMGTVGPPGCTHTSFSPRTV